MCLVDKNFRVEGCSKKMAWERKWLLIEDLLFEFTEEDCEALDDGSKVQRMGHTRY